MLVVPCEQANGTYSCTQASMHMPLMAADSYRSWLDSVKIIYVLPQHISPVTDWFLPHARLLLILDTGPVWSAGVVSRINCIKPCDAWGIA